MISEEGQAYIARAEPFWDDCKDYLRSKAEGTTFKSRLERLHLSEDLGLYVPHLAAFLFYFTEMAEAPHDDTLAFIGTGMDEHGKPKVIDRELVNSYGAIRQMYEAPGMDPLREQMNKEELVLFLLGSFPGRSDYTESPINPGLQDIRYFLAYIDALFNYFNEAQRQRHAEVREIIKEGMTRKDEILKSMEAKPKGPCFVATAVYEDANHPRVNALRRWRDGTLRQTMVGRAFIRWYYRRGAALARVVTTVPGLRTVVRRGLDFWVGVVGR